MRYTQPAPSPTPDQAALLDFIFTYCQDNGRPPSFRDMMPIVGLASTHSMHARIAELKDAGMVSQDGSGRRAVALTAPPAPLPCRRCGRMVRHYCINQGSTPSRLPFRLYAPILHDCHDSD